MELSKRLQAVADLVTAGMSVADIGTDHGYVPIYLVKTKKVPKALAMDINQGPLDRAIKNIESHSLGKYIKTRRSEGLAELAQGEAESVVIAGMGGALIMKILAAGSKFKGIKEYVLQPQSEIPKFRAFLKDGGYHIITEDMVFEEGKFYNIIKVTKETCHVEDDTTEHIFLGDKEKKLYGKYLLQHHHPTLKLFIQKEIAIKEGVINTLKSNKGMQIDQRIKEVEEEVAYAEQILYRYY